MTPPLTAVLLAGMLQPPPLREALDVPILCLPLGRKGTMLDHWLESLATVPSLREVRIVVSTRTDATRIREMNQEARSRPGELPIVRVIRDPAPWRGAAGVMRDVAIDLPMEAAVLVVETKRLPPPTVRPVLDALADGMAGVIGVSHDWEPSGVSVFRRPVLDLIPPIGYFDMKEQLLPDVREKNMNVVTAQIDDRIIRVRDRRGYLQAVRATLGEGTGITSNSRISPQASVSGSAVLDGFCIIEAGAVVEDGAVVSDSVVLQGATIGGGAVVSRSVVGPLGVVEPRHRIVHEIVNAPMTPMTVMRHMAESSLEF